MKTIIIATAVAALALGASAAQAQSNSTEANVKADASMSAPKPAVRHHRKYRRHTTGIGSENNASAPGSRLPGKDKLNSKAYIQEH